MLNILSRTKFLIDHVANVIAGVISQASMFSFVNNMNM